MQGRRTWVLGIGLRKLVVLALNNSSNIQVRLILFFFIPMFSPKANMNVCFFISTTLPYVCAIA